MSTEHTQGRLTVVMNSTCSAAWPELNDADGITVAELEVSHIEKRRAINRGTPGGFNEKPERFKLDQLYGEHVLANARRLVACWNACEGVSTEMLETARITMLSVLRPGEPTGPGGAVSAPIPTPLMTPAGQIEVMLAALQDIAQHSDAYGLRAKAALEKIGVAS